MAVPEFSRKKKLLFFSLGDFCLYFTTGSSILSNNVLKAGVLQLFSRRRRGNQSRATQCEHAVTVETEHACAKHGQQTDRAPISAPLPRRQLWLAWVKERTFLLHILQIIILMTFFL